MHARSCKILWNKLASERNCQKKKTYVKIKIETSTAMYSLQTKQLATGFWMDVLLVGYNVLTARLDSVQLEQEKDEFSRNLITPK
jgi:hypothetical protein